MSGSEEGTTAVLRSRVVRAAGPALGVLLVALSIWILHRELAEYHLQDVMRRLHAIPTREVVASLLVTAVSYFVLTGYDALALRWVGKQLAYRKVAFASFIGFVFSHNIGLSFFGGSAVRYRLLTGFGLRPGEIGRVVAFNLVTFWLGFLGLGGLVLATAPSPIPHALPLPFATTRPIGVAMLLALASYAAWSLRRREPVVVHGFAMPVPSPRFTGLQLALSAVDWALAAAALYVLLPAEGAPSFPAFVGLYLLAQVVGLVSHVPGGLGVFEGMMVLLLARTLPGDVVLGSVFAYRVIYYLIPMAMAVVLFAGYEGVQRRRHLELAQQLAAEWMPAVVPRILAFTTFVAGVILLVSGATPAAPRRLHLLAQVLPLPAIEISHFLGSLIGVALLLLARAIQQRVDAGYVLGLVLLAGGAAVSLLKGLDWEEASILSAMFLALLPCRRFFHRRSTLLGASFSVDWMIGVALVIAGTFFVTMLAYRHVEYRDALWWQFEVSAQASRSLRALVGAAGLLAFFALARLLRPSPPAFPDPTPEDVERALAVIRASPRSESHLALLGDKKILLHEAGDAFVMFGVQGDSWIAMGDPVGPAPRRRELAWRFRELADLHGDRVAFYEVGADDLPVYLDLGLELRKLGEAARVPLAAFSLVGSERKGLRQTESRMKREGCSFEVLPAERVPPLLDELEAISDGWLAAKHTREKRFSLGFFDRAYLARLPVAVVRRDQRILAFANVWQSAGRAELSADLMRYTEDAPAGVMEFLFIELMLWGKEQGFRHFNMGMAPLSGFERHRLAPPWNRLGAILFRHGEHFYNFKGLRAFKEKFRPEWEPRFLASPGGLTVPLVLTQVAALVGGSIAGVVSR